MSEITELQKAAKAGGFTHFHTGKPCKNGHIANRVTRNGTCVECNKDHQKKYKKANPEQHKANMRRHYAKYGEYYRAYHRVRYYKARLAEAQQELDSMVKVPKPSL